MSREAVEYSSPEALVAPLHWGVRWGNVALLGAVIAGLLAASFVPYPDAIKGSAAIAADPPPTAAVARMPGALTILVRDGDRVAERAPLAVVETAARLSDVRALRAMLVEEVDVAHAYPTLRVGELQPHYASFLDAVNRWRDHVADPHARGSEMQLALEIDYAERQLLADGAQLASVTARAELTRSAHDRTRALHAQKLIADQDVERAQAALLEARGAIESGRAAQAMSSARVTRYRQALADFRHDRAVQAAQRSRAAEEARQNLLAQLDQWEALHVIAAPHAGRVWFLPAAVDRQHVGAEQPVMIVLPDEWRAIARIDVPLHRSGDLAAGQEVVVELSEYPTGEHPPLRGKVRSVSPMPRDGRYVVAAELMQTPKTPPLKPGMTGQGRIVTRDRALLSRLLDRILPRESR